MRERSKSTEHIVIAVMVVLSVAGRFIFAWMPGFKPVTAITVIVGMCLGKNAGFSVGALSALVSNFYFGQGPWTPFQMMSWGIIGLMAGVFAKLLKKSKVALCIYGVLSGFMYSAFLDMWTTLWIDGHFNASRYVATFISSLPVTIEYAVSNVVFLIVLSKPIGDKLTRIKKKYGLFIDSQ